MLAALRRLLRPALLVSCAALALGAGTGCAPVVSLHHTEVRGPSAGGLGVVAVLVVENENAFDVQVRRVSAQVTIADRYRLDNVDIAPNKWIPAGGKVRVSVPLTIPWTTVPGVLAASGSSAEVTYRVRGTADVVAGRSARIRAQHFPIDQEGVIPRNSLGGGRGGGLPMPF